MKKALVLVILDGWGIGKKDQGNPIYTAKLETVPFIEASFPACALQASGIAVGLPWGEEGNSEVGHLTIGAGLVLYQHFPRISLAIKDGSFFEQAELKKIFAHTREKKSRLHLIGLLTEGNVHASLEHIEALIDMAKKENCPKIILHLFSDGRDSDPKSGKELAKRIEQKLEESGIGEIASITGRSFAMDRDKRWERTEKTYRILTDTSGPYAKTVEMAFETAYQKEITDEFIEPTHIGTREIITDGDAIFFFNFREDRMRQLTESFWNKEFSAFPIKQWKELALASMTSYDTRSPLPAAFPRELVENSLGKVIAEQGKTQLRIAETEKYAHITYFLNGLREKPFPGEYRILIPSSRTVRYQEHPEMQASAITDRILLALEEGGFDVIIANYANPDMVAHTGDFEATMAAVQTVDRELGRLLKGVRGGDHTLIITSDHGNAEVVLDLQTGEHETKHNANPVPFYLVANRFAKKNLDGNRIGKKLPTIGILADVAPTILRLLDIPKPPSMTGQNLLEELLLING